MRVRKLASVILALMISGCSTTAPTSSGLGRSLSADEIREYDKEYSSFSTKALTLSYLLRKLQTLLQLPQGNALVKELKYGQFKYPELLSQLFRDNPDNQGLLTLINQVQAVSDERSVNPKFALFLDSLAITAVASNFPVTTIAGNDNFYVDADRLNASFSQPSNLVFDSQGNLFVTEAQNRRVRKISPQGDVTTVAGNGDCNLTDGNGTNSSICYPDGIAIDNSNNLYVTEDNHNNRIRKITPAGDVTIFAGTNDFNGGFAEGQGTAARFSTPMDIAFYAGNLFVTDAGNNKIRKIDSNGNVTVLTNSGFFVPLGISADAAGNLFVTQISGKITKIDSSGNSTIIYAGGVSGTNASFNFPADIVPDGTGNLYVTDKNNNRIRKIDSNNNITTFAGTGPLFDGNGTNASFNEPLGITIDNSGNLFVADSSNNKIRKIDSSGNVTTFAGTGTFNDGSRSNARFSFPEAITKDNEGNIYIADTGNHRIRKMDTAGNVTTIAGSFNGGFSDGNGSNASFSLPLGIVRDSHGSLFVTDYQNNAIRKITPDGEVTTFAGSGSPGNDNGNGTDASFDSPTGIAIDPQDNLYVTDSINYLIRKITPDGEVSTLADGNDPATPFGYPHVITRDNNTGNLYFSDMDYNVIRKLTPSGVLTVYAGSGEFDYIDARGTNAAFNSPEGLVVDNSGNLYVSDTTNQRVRKVAPNGDVTTIAGNGEFAYMDGTGTNASFNNPAGILVDNNGDLIVSDLGGRMRKIDL
jgi:sugar lactone lactonase YvrE